jgi:membrane associated rhomboid family serine protease
MFLPLRDNLNFKGLPLLTFLFIAINVAVFVGWQGGSNLDTEKIANYSLIPYEVTHPGKQCVPSSPTDFEFSCDNEAKIERETGQELPHTAITVVTSMFMHGGWGHLIGNMIFLFAFGVSLELALGRFAFVLFYLAGGVGAEAAHVLFDASSPVPSLGASGAISAVMGGFLMLFAAAKIRTLVWLLPPILVWIRAYLVIGLWLLLQVLEAYFVLSTFGKDGGGVAYFAHFGGFATGLLLLMIVTNKQFVEQQRLHAKLASGDVMLVREEHVTDPATPQGVAQAATATVAHADPFAQPQPPQFAQPQPQQFAQPPAAAHVDPFAQPQPAQFAQPPQPPQFAPPQPPQFAQQPAQFAQPQAPQFAPPPGPAPAYAPAPDLSQAPPPAPAPPQPPSDLSQAPPPPPPPPAAAA